MKQRVRLSAYALLYSILVMFARFFLGNYPKRDRGMTWYHLLPSTEHGDCVAAKRTYRTKTPRCRRGNRKERRRIIAITSERAG